MKHLYLLICLSIMAFSCKKNEEKPTATLPGKWHYIGNSGGLAANRPLQLETRYHIYYTFTTDGKYTIQNVERNETVSGVYQLTNSFPEMYIVQDGSTLKYPYHFRISHDTLYMTEAFPDAATNHLIKQ